MVIYDGFATCFVLCLAFCIYTSDDLGLRYFILQFSSDEMLTLTGDRPETEH